MEIENVGNKFKVAILAAKRAKQIMKNGKKKIDMNASNPLTIALEEIKQGLVTNDTLIQDEKNLILNVDVELDETETVENNENETLELSEEKKSEQMVNTEDDLEESTKDKKATDEDILKKNLTE